MSWFGALIDGAASGVGWVINNAGDISSAYNSIKNVISGGSTDFIGDGVGNIVPSLRDALENNEAAMATTAQNIMNSPSFTNFTKDLDLSPSGQILEDTFEYAGILPSTALLAKGQAPQAIIADLNKLLTLRGFPTVVDGADVGQQIGAQMFSTNDQVAAKFLPANAPNAVLYKSPAINVGTPQSSARVQAQHVFYPVPVNGTKVDDDTLHSYTQIMTFQPADAQKALREQRRALALPISRRRNKGNVPEPYNSTTVSATWNTTGNDAVMKQVVTTMPSSTYQLSSESNDGLSYKYQFQTDVSVGAGAVLQAFDVAIAAVITSGNLPTTDIVQQQTILA